MSAFGQAFAAARKRLGAGKTFSFNGKSYSTNTAEDKPARATSLRPQARPTSDVESNVPAKPAAMGGGARGSARPASAKVPGSYTPDVESNRPGMVYVPPKLRGSRGTWVNR